MDSAIQVSKDYKWENYSFLPIMNKPFYENFKKQYGNFWFDTAISWQGAYSDYEQLSKKTQHTVDFLLAFFSQADGLIGEGLDELIIELSNLDPPIPKEALSFYRFQGAVEVVHNLVYSQNIEHYIRDPEKKASIMNGISRYSSIKSLAEWFVKKCENASVIEKIVLFAMVEGVWFSGLFAIPYWIRKIYGQLMEALGLSNEWISRDEAIHRDNGIDMYKWLVATHDMYVGEEKFREWMIESMELLTHFYTDAVPVPEHDLNAPDLMKYVKVCADNFAEELGFSVVFNEENPYPWLLTMGLQRKTNFFEKHVSEYSHSSEEKQEFCIDYALLE